MMPSDLFPGVLPPFDVWDKIDVDDNGYGTVHYTYQPILPIDFITITIPEQK